MEKLKNQPLSLQIWLIFTSVIVIIFVLLALYFSITIRNFFTDEIYNTIEVAQENTIQKAAGLIDSTSDISTGAVSNDISEVKHIRLNYSNDAADLAKIEKLIPNKTQAELFLRKLKNQVKNQTNTTQRYVESTSSCRVLYVLRVNGINKNGAFIVSYMWDTYRNSLATNLMIKLFPVMIIALILSLIAAKYLAQKLVIPLKELDTRVKKIGKK